MLSRAGLEPAAGTTQLSRAGTLVYRAYSRPYNTRGVRVLHLFASGEYNLAPVQVFFKPVAGKPNTFVLVERVPGVVYSLKNYVSASYSSGCGSPGLAGTVRIVDAHGEHIVGVDPLD